MRRSSVRRLASAAGEICASFQPSQNELIDRIARPRRAAHGGQRRPPGRFKRPMRCIVRAPRRSTPPKSAFASPKAAFPSRPAASARRLSPESAAPARFARRMRHNGACTGFQPLGRLLAHSPAAVQPAALRYPGHGTSGKTRSISAAHRGENQCSAPPPRNAQAAWLPTASRKTQARPKMLACAPWHDQAVAYRI